MSLPPQPLRIGVPVLNRGDLLRRLVDSVDVPADVLIVVNAIGPVDASVADAVGALEGAARPDVRVRVERVAGNLGVSGSWNLILDRFGGDCLIANSDIVFGPGALQTAMTAVDQNRGVVLHHLWAAACFYATAAFTATLGWFDENFYPAYHEDQEMSLRRVAMGVKAAIVPGLGEHGVVHGGSQTLKSASPAVRTYLGRAKAVSRDYLTRRWGALPPRGQTTPEKPTPWGDPAAHPADWALDLDARAAVAALCREITGFDCPVVYHRSRGGLSPCSS